MRSPKIFLIFIVYYGILKTEVKLCLDIDKDHIFRITHKELICKSSYIKNEPEDLPDSHI